MNKEKLSIGNIVMAGRWAWKIISIHSGHVYACQFDQPAVTGNIRFEDIRGIPINIENVELYLGIKMELDKTDVSMPEEQDWYDVETHRIRLSDIQWRLNCPHASDAKAWFCHLDNECMDSIGTADLLYINELQNFLNIFK